jgi:homopolymeric O-antigen transport system ATP-binding protein
MNSLITSKPGVVSKIDEQSLFPSQEAIRLEKVGVRYRAPSERIPSIKEYVIRWMQGKIKHREFWALRDVDLIVKRGETIGVIGPNGAGKSTLSKLVARVLKPTAGRVLVRGQVAPLLEFGAGFHPELSGRENIYLNGALLGFSRKQMDERFNHIVDYAELWDFIDAPMRTYSSGMWARLGFAVATDVNPDILIIDEVLSVGDESFQHKSAARMQEFRQLGATILFVSHNMTVVEEMCHRVAWLDHGRLMEVGFPTDVIRAYRDFQIR